MEGQLDHLQQNPLDSPHPPAQFKQSGGAHLKQTTQTSLARAKTRPSSGILVEECCKSHQPEHTLPLANNHQYRKQLLFFLAQPTPRRYSRPQTISDNIINAAVKQRDKSEMPF
ncbi:MAG: hypothetical protein GY818_04010 [Planctomycetaceae bacterium]|nr:hypothetical protein [Planctomycetaceae bacterium]